MLAISTPSVTDDGEGSLTPKQEDSHRRMASDDEEDMALTSKAFFSVKFETILFAFCVLFFASRQGKATWISLFNTPSV